VVRAETQVAKESDRKKEVVRAETEVAKESNRKKEVVRTETQVVQESDRKKEEEVRAEIQETQERDRKKKEEMKTETKVAQKSKGEEDEYKDIVLLLPGTVEEDLDYSDSSSEDDSDMTPSGDLKSRNKEIRSKLENIRTKIIQKDEELDQLNRGVKDKKDLQQKAIEILTVGAMPLCPPARRNWTRRNTLDLDVGGTTIQWPPKDFETMTPDQKLLSWEYMAMRIEEQGQGKFPTKPRQLLLDTYNFLALPGTRKSSDNQDRATRKIRYYNYQLVRQVAKGDLISEECKAIMETLLRLQGGPKRTLAEVMAGQMDVTRFPLRLEKD